MIDTRTMCVCVCCVFIRNSIWNGIQRGEIEEFPEGHEHKPNSYGCSLRGYNGKLPLNQAFPMSLAYRKRWFDWTKIERCIRDLYHSGFRFGSALWLVTKWNGLMDGSPPPSVFIANTFVSCSDIARHCFIHFIDEFLSHVILHTGNVILICQWIVNTGHFSLAIKSPFWQRWFLSTSAACCFTEWPFLCVCMSVWMTAVKRRASWKAHNDGLGHWERSWRNDL